MLVVCVVGMCYVHSVDWWGVGEGIVGVREVTFPLRGCSLCVRGRLLCKCPGRAERGGEGSLV